MPRTIGLYGGFFNPFHKGHLHVIQTALQSLNLDELVVLPTFHNPLKNNSHTESIEQQISNIQSEINLPNVKVSDFEHSHQITSTQELLKKIQNKYPLNSCYLIIGLDQLGKLHLWKEYQWIIQNISICVIYRPRYDDFIENSQVQKENPELFMPNLDTFINNSMPCIHVINNGGVDISSSELRH
tara:strand:+ start:119 stop:673 length:555 start_codon:yes stop_codon:yes gene_type:complete